MAAALTLLTDFGTSDGYAGALVGRAWRASPGLQVVTLTHDVPLGNVPAGAYWLAATVPAFPPGTVHCAIVGPRAGSDRPLVAAEVDRQLLVAPDNGLLCHAWLRGTQRRAVRIDTARLRMPPRPGGPPGLDLIVPIGARLAGGELRLEDLGPQVAAPMALPGVGDRGDALGTDARVLVVDHCGSAVLSVTRTPWYDPVPVAATLEDGRRIECLAQSHAAIPRGFALVWNAADHLEIAGNGVSAAAALGLRVGDPVRVDWAASEGRSEPDVRRWVAASLGARR
ncbi:MAG TPA: SAM-dependent chlorinase/fluorinase [Candidatus Micrarchaeia archaeon]|nr:SAM-dependent chlorinase/fluorinase [Candidatus Micrarchaeia archaeon]